MDTSPEAFWHFGGIVLTIFLSALYGRIGRTGPFWQILCRLPATALHEVAHYAVALVTGASPTGFTIIPSRRDTVLADGSAQREWVLGSVTLQRPGMLSSLPSGLAPLMLVPAAWLAWDQWFQWFPRDLSHTLALYVAMTLLCCSSVPSRQDLRVALSRPGGVVFYAGVAMAAVLVMQM